MVPAELDHATRYANRLLQDLSDGRPLAAPPETHPAVRWAHSGSMALTGYPGEPAQMCPVPLASYADGIVAALRNFRPRSPLSAIDGARLLGERAALAAYERRGDIAAGGSCRLLQAADGWLAVNLARPSDWEMLPAWLQAGAISHWAAVAAALKSRSLGECVERGRLLGLALAPLESGEPPPGPWCRELERGAPRPREHSAAPLVIDLSSLWAGPLCAHLLQMMGARVIKVESSGRPDGMRYAASGFYDLLNAGKASVALDFNLPVARAQLRQLLLRADIVIEASRPRALRQLGILAEEILDGNPGLTWVAISGHGREEPAAAWIAYGDDGAVAGGLSQVLWDCSGRAMFCGDAIADPLTGLHAALAAWSSFERGGGRLLSLALRDVVAHGVAFAALSDGAASRARVAEWNRHVRGSDVAAPSSRAIRDKARALGADTLEIVSGAGTSR
jgi:hypothetical protein